MGKASREKGLRWEREGAKDLTDRTGVTHKRVLTETRDGGGIDVRPRPPMPFAYQFKCGARPDIYGAMKEVTAAAGSDFAVVAVHRTGRGGEKLAVLPWDDWLEIATMIAERCA